MPGGFDKDSERAVHFLVPRASDALREAVRRAPDGFSLVDLGCGDGASTYALRSAGGLQRAGRVVGVDLSPLRVERYARNTGFPGIACGADRVDGIADGSVDVVVSAMTIEHVPDDAAMLREARRMLAPGGVLYLSTVIRRPGAWYFRRAPDGRRVLDVTHVREYPSREAVERVVRDAGFRVERVDVQRLAFSVAQPLVRVLHRLLPFDDVNRVFAQGGIAARLERVTVRVPRYRSIELLAVRA